MAPVTARSRPSASAALLAARLLHAGALAHIAQQQQGAGHGPIRREQGAHAQLHRLLARSVQKAHVVHAGARQAAEHRAQGDTERRAYKQRGQGATE